MDIAQAAERVRAGLNEVRKAVVGQDAVLDQVACVLLAGGHAILEGVPGTAKTLLVRALSHVLGLSFRRIQFTPDLMPSDVVGVSVYNTATGEFLFRPGPIFADLVLADEINRSPAKTQAALLEAMQERQATVDGVTHSLPEGFTVFATENPVEFEGTYPLPEAQLDRFLFKIMVGYPSAEDEATILDRVEAGFQDTDLPAAGLAAVFSRESIADLRRAARGVRVEEKVRRYVTQIVRATRKAASIGIGASPRAGVMLLLAAKAMALLAGRDFVTPDDVKSAALPALRHRLVLLPEVEIEGRTADQVLGEVVRSIEVPR